LVNLLTFILVRIMYIMLNITYCNVF